MPETCERQWFDNCPLFIAILLLVIMPNIVSFIKVRMHLDGILVRMSASICWVPLGASQADGETVLVASSEVVVASASCNHPSGSCPWDCASNGGGCMWSGSGLRESSSE
jgi:hypothetical protein